MKKNVFILLFLIIASVNLQGSSLRIEINELSSNLSKYKILDVRTKEQFLEGHIKSALNLPVSLTYENKKIDGKILQPNKMQKILRDLGLDVNDKIVVYGDSTFFDASRVFWALEVYGFKSVKLLNAGYIEWEVSDLEISKKIRKVKKSNYIASIDNKRLATKFTTQIATKNKSQIIVDARSRNSYIGKESSAKRYGHIPKAIHIPATHNIKNKDSLAKLKDLEELGEIYKGIEKNKKVVIYCAIGRIASTNYFALRELGYNVANYDASWKEWGNDFNLPIINLSKSN